MARSSLNDLLSFLNCQFRRYQFLFENPLYAAYFICSMVIPVYFFIQNDHKENCQSPNKQENKKHGSSLGNPGSMHQYSRTRNYGTSMGIACW